MCSIAEAHQEKKFGRKLGGFRFFRKNGFLEKMKDGFLYIKRIFGQFFKKLYRNSLGFSCAHSMNTSDKK